MERFPKKELHQMGFGELFGGLSSHGEAKEAADALREHLAKAKFIHRGGALQGVVLPEVPNEEQDKVVKLFSVMGIYPWVEKADDEHVRMLVEYPRDFQKLRFFDLLERPSDAPQEPPVEKKMTDLYGFPLPTIPKDGETKERARVEKEEPEVSPEDLELDAFLEKAVERFDQGLEAEPEQIVTAENTRHPNMKQFPRKYSWDGKGFATKNGEYISFEAYRKIVSGAKDDPQKMEQAVEMGVGLVKSVLDRIIERFGSSHEVTADDLFQEGMIGLVKALQRIEDRPETRPSSYLVPYIEGYMRHFLKTHHHHGIKVGKGVMEGRAKYIRAKNELLEDPKYRDATTGELDYLISEKTQQPLDKTRLIGKALSITQEEFDEENISPEDIEEPKPLIEKDTLEHTQLQAVFEQMLNKLSPRQEIAIRLYFGLTESKKWHDIENIKELLKKGDRGDLPIDEARIDRLLAFDPTQDDTEGFNDAEKVFLVLLGKLPKEEADGLQRDGSEDTPSTVTLEDISEIFGITRSSINLWIVKGLRTMKHPAVFKMLEQAGYIKREKRKYYYRGEEVETTGWFLDER